MTFSFVQPPPNAGGPKLRTRSRDVGSDTVHEQYVVAHSHDRLPTTVYRFHSGTLVVGAAADGANVGRLYVENDPDSTVLIAVTRVEFRSQIGSALAAPTSPRIVLRRFTFTGNTPSGAAIAGAKLDSAFPAKNANWDVRTAATGMTITEAADLAGFFPTASATAVGYAPPAEAVWRPDPDRPLILRAGHGLMVKQADAGTTSDTRRFTVDVEVEEFVAES